MEARFNPSSGIRGFRTGIARTRWTSPVIRFNPSSGIRGFRTKTAVVRVGKGITFQSLFRD